LRGSLHRGVATFKMAMWSIGKLGKKYWVDIQKKESGKQTGRKGNRSGGRGVTRIPRSGSTDVVIRRKSRNGRKSWPEGRIKNPGGKEGVEQVKMGGELIAQRGSNLSAMKGSKAKVKERGHMGRTLSTVKK